jgi:hypothetical protein
MKVGYEVTGTRPVCIDHLDGRTVAYPPGTTFVADSKNTSANRAFRLKMLRKIDRARVTTVKLGVDPVVQAKIDAAKRNAARNG